MIVLRYRPPPTLQPGASTRIDLLRLLLVAQVVFGHLAMIAYPTFSQLDFDRVKDAFVAVYRLGTRFGPQSAYVFVCMSGFFLGPRLLAAGLCQSDAEPLQQFLADRLRRIYPTLLVALLLTFACDLAGIYLLGAEPFYRRLHYYDSVEALDPMIALGNLLSLQPTFVGSFGTNAPLWTLGYIVQFYISATVLAAIMRANRRLAFCGLVAILIAGGFSWCAEWSLLFICWLACGMLRWVRPGSARSGWAALAVGLCLFVVAKLLPVEGSVIASGAAGALFLLGVSSQLNPTGPEQLPHWLARLNTASFPLYAFHFPLSVLLYAALAPRLDTATLGFRIAWPMFALALALLFALPFQALLDRKARRVAA